MLRNTLVLPETDARLSVRMLRDAIESLDVVLMLILGKGDRVNQMVEWADQLCNKTKTADGNLRKVVWIREFSTQTVQDAVRELTGSGALPQVVVLNFFDQVRKTMGPDDPVSPIQLELAFLEGHKQ